MGSRLLLVLAVLLSGCGSDADDSGRLGLPGTPGSLQSTFAVSSAPPALAISGLGGIPGAPSTMLSGVVYAATATGNMPLPNAEVRVQSVSGQVSSAISDSAGRYQIAVIHPINGSPGGITALQALKPGYRMACRPTIAHIVWPDGQSHQTDIYLVSDSTLVTTGVPAAMPRPASSLSGIVFEQSPEGVRPLVGVRVAAAPTFTETLSDAQGRYLLCGFAEPYPGWFMSYPDNDEDAVSTRVGDIQLTTARVAYAATSTTLNVHTTTSHDIQLVGR